MSDLAASLAPLPGRYRRTQDKRMPPAAGNLADHQRSQWMAAVQAGDAAAYQALLRDCLPVIAPPSQELEPPANPGRFRCGCAAGRRCRSAI